MQKCSKVDFVEGAQLISEKYDFFFKFLLVGDVGVGKSSLCSRFTKDLFSETYTTTLNMDFVNFIACIDYLDDTNSSNRYKVYQTSNRTDFNSPNYIVGYTKSEIPIQTRSLSKLLQRGSCYYTCI